MTYKVRSLLCASLLSAFACYGRVHETAAVYTPLTTFPPLGPALQVARGIVVHEVSLAHDGQPGRVWIYLPETLPSKPLPCVFIAPAGVPPFLGNGFGPFLDRQRHPEHLPYLRAGFAVVAYDVDGEVADRDNSTYADVRKAATAFKNADAGVINARHAIDYVVKMVPAIDPARLYVAGHSSAGRVSLLVAEREPRIAACIAYAPVSDAERRSEEIAGDATRFLESEVPGFREFLKESSPIRQVDHLHCPTFIFHSEGDTRIPIAESDAFVAQLKQRNNSVTYVRTSHGGHYDSMIEEGVPKAISWLREIASLK